MLLLLLLLVHMCGVMLCTRRSLMLLLVHCVHADHGARLCCHGGLLLQSYQGGEGCGAQVWQRSCVSLRVLCMPDQPLTSVTAVFLANVWTCQTRLIQLFSSFALRSSNYTILVSIAAPQPLRPAVGDHHTLIYIRLPSLSKRWSAPNSTHSGFSVQSDKKVNSDKCNTSRARLLPHQVHGCRQCNYNVCARTHGRAWHGMV